MPEHVWTVLSQRSIIDRETNNVTLVETVERVSPAKLPNVQAELGENSQALFRFFITTWWVRSEPDTPEECPPARIRLAAPNGKKLLITDYEIKLLENDSWRMRIQFDSFPIGLGFGRYWFENQVQTPSGRWKTVARVPVTLPRPSGEELALSAEER